VLTSGVGNARKTNYDYNKGKLDELVDVMIEGGCKLFVCAIGIPPKGEIDCALAVLPSTSS
jgi:hypothetical protein